MRDYNVWFYREMYGKLSLSFYNFLLGALAFLCVMLEYQGVE